MSMMGYAYFEWQNNSMGIMLSLVGLRRYNIMIDGCKWRAHDKDCMSLYVLNRVISNMFNPFESQWIQLKCVEGIVPCVVTPYIKGERVKTTSACVG